MAEQDVTRLLTEWSEGDPAALDRLLPLVYADLRRIAARQLRSERREHTLSATAVVHDLDLLALDRALDELAALDPRVARIVELRFFGGLSLDDAALAMDISRRTVAREWALARAWLLRRLEALRGERPSA